MLGGDRRRRLRHRPRGRGLVKIPQIGRVVIGDDVEVGANTTIDRGALDDTVLEEGVKLDNQIQIGHNVRVGAHTAMAGCVAVAGSADIGKRCTLGAAAVILGHLSIADDVHVSAGTVISRSIHKAGTYTGMFPFDENASWARNTALVRHLAELAERCARWSEREKTMVEMDILQVLEHLPQRFPMLMNRPGEGMRATRQRHDARCGLAFLHPVDHQHREALRQVLEDLQDVHLNHVFSLSLQRAQPFRQLGEMRTRAVLRAQDAFSSNGNMPV